MADRDMRAHVAALAGAAVIAALATAGHAGAAPGSACAQLGGTVGSDKVCEVRYSTTNYDLTFRFPTDYPDQQSVADYLTQKRKDFVDWVGANSLPSRTHPAELDVIGRAYQSSETQSLVFDIGEDTGVHPVNTFKAFNYNLATGAPITFDTLFMTGTDPLAVLNPIVRQQAAKRDPTATVGDLTASAYQQFAITDDAIIFFFNQDGLLPHVDGPLEVTVPRSDLASMLA
ncbi:MAG: esterase [Mycobacterium sp.]